MAERSSKARRGGGRRRRAKTDESAIEFSSNGDHANDLLQELHLQRVTGQLCDVVLIVENRKFPVHRNVLSACSPYFKSMFEGSRFIESRQKEVKLMSLSSQAVESLLNYVYTDKITISDSNAEGIIAASDLFLLQKVREYCAQYWTQTLCVDNVLSAYRNADTYNLDQLRKEAESFLSKHFSCIVESNEFVNFPKEVVIVMIKSDLVEVEEIEVFKALMKWVNHCEDERKEYLDELMSYIRLPLMPAPDLIGDVQKNPMVRHSEWCLELIQEAMSYQLLPDKHGEHQSPRTRPRYGNLDEVIFAVGVTGTEGDETPDWLLTKCFVPRLNNWFSLASLNASALRGLAFCNGYLYAVCFKSDNENLDLYKYNIESNTWSQCASVSKANHVIRSTYPSQDTWVQLVKCGVKLYMFVSALRSQEERISTSALCYNTQYNKWKVLATMKIQRLYFSTVCKDVNIYIIGGKVPCGDSTAEMECFNTTNEMWTLKADMQLARHSMNVCFLMPDGDILVSDYECRDPDVYNELLDNWSSFSHEVELADSLPIFFTDCPGGNEMISVFSSATSTLYATCEASFDEYLAAWYKFKMDDKRWEPCTSLPQLMMPFLCAVK
ncbi:kelch-like protein 24 [Glandiceps talaboti]